MIPPVKSIASLVKADTVPPGWYTREDCQKVWNVSQSRACRLIRLAIENKKAVMKKFSIKTEGRGVFPTVHYKFR